MRRAEIILVNIQSRDFSQDSSEAQEELRQAIECKNNVPVFSLLLSPFYTVNCGVLAICCMFEGLVLYIYLITNTVVIKLSISASIL